MNTNDLLKRVRSRLRDDVGSSADSLWSDEDLIDDYANTARTTLFTRTRRMIVDSSTATDLANLPLCSIPIVAGTATYAVSPKMFQVARIILSTGNQPLVMKTVSELDAINPNWQSADAGEPWAYCTEMDTDKITLYPKPIASGTASLQVFRFPLVALAASKGTADLGFREEYHADLIYGIQELCFQKKDNEVDNPKLSADYAKRFKDRCDEIKYELLMRNSGSRSVRPRKAFMTR